MLETLIVLTILAGMTFGYFNGREEREREIRFKIQSLHKGESNDLMDKGWNEAIEHITKNVL
jgi:hypothetical protein